MIKKAFRNLNNKNGAAMILAILVIAVMAFLGTALWMYSTTDTLHVTREEKKVQAYYVARSAADTVAEYMIKNPYAAKSIISTTGVTGTSTVNNAPGLKDFTVKVTDKGSNVIDIEATGTVNGISDKVTLRMKRTPVNSGCTFDNALFAMSNIRINGDSYTITDGDISANGTIDVMNPDDNIINGDARPQCNPPIIYDPMISPDWGTYPKYVNSTYYNTNTPITESLEFEDINVKSLTFDISNNDIYLKVGSYTSGDIIIKDTSSNHHSLYMYVDSFTLKGIGHINPTGLASNFVLVPNNNNASIDLTCSGTSTFNGVVYAPTVNIRCNGTPNYTGAIIANNFTGNGTINITKPDELTNYTIPGTEPYSGYEKVQWR